MRKGKQHRRMLNVCSSNHTLTRLKWAIGIHVIVHVIASWAFHIQHSKNLGHFCMYSQPFCLLLVISILSGLPVRNFTSLAASSLVSTTCMETIFDLEYILNSRLVAWQCISINSKCLSLSDSTLAIYSNNTLIFGHVNL